MKETHAPARLCIGVMFAQFCERRAANAGLRRQPLPGGSVRMRQSMASPESIKELIEQPLCAGHRPQYASQEPRCYPQHCASSKPPTLRGEARKGCDATTQASHNSTIHHSV